MRHSEISADIYRIKHELLSGVACDLSISVGLEREEKRQLIILVLSISLVPHFSNSAGKVNRLFNNIFQLVVQLAQVPSLGPLQAEAQTFAMLRIIKFLIEICVCF